MHPPKYVGKTRGKLSLMMVEGGGDDGGGCRGLVRLPAGDARRLYAMSFVSLGRINRKEASLHQKKKKKGAVNKHTTSASVWVLSFSSYQYTVYSGSAATEAPLYLH